MYEPKKNKNSTQTHIIITENFKRQQTKQQQRNQHSTHIFVAHEFVFLFPTTLKKKINHTTSIKTHIARDKQFEREKIFQCSICCCCCQSSDDLHDLKFWKIILYEKKYEITWRLFCSKILSIERRNMN